MPVLVLCVVDRHGRVVASLSEDLGKWEPLGECLIRSPVLVIWPLHHYTLLPWVDALRGVCVERRLLECLLGGVHLLAVLYIFRGGERLIRYAYPMDFDLAVPVFVVGEAGAQGKVEVRRFCVIPVHFLRVIVVDHASCPMCFSGGPVALILDGSFEDEYGAHSCVAEPRGSFLALCLFTGLLDLLGSHDFRLRAGHP